MATTSSLEVPIEALGSAMRDQRGWKSLNKAIVSSGFCAHPIHLALAESDGEIPFWAPMFVRGSYEGVYSKACGSRRASRCPACSRIYKGDARELIRCGLLGGKTMPESFAEHAKIFATLTAPSFGSVHRIIRQNAKYERCHAGKSEICPHGVKLNCYRRHTEKDENVGAPLCAECYDFEGAAIWNASVTDLWRYTTIYFKRELAKMCGLSGAEFRDEARIEYIKVVEYQARGLIHLHVVVRVDDADSNALSPGVTITSEMLEIALKIAAQKVCIEKDFDSNCYRIAWGSQLDTRPIIGDTTKAVVNYLVKYSTKSSSESTGFDRRFKSSADIEKLEAPEHLKELARTAFRLGNDARYAPLNLAHWAHDLGHRGHFLTKSRRFSLTFAHLRFIRQLWRMQQVMESASDDSAWRPLGSMVFVGQGWLSRVHAYWAWVQREDDREGRELAWEQVMEERELEGASW